MKILLVDKNNNLLLSKQWSWEEEIIVNQNINMSINEDWVVIKLLNDYYSWSEPVEVISLEWEIWYKTWKELGNDYN